MKSYDILMRTPIGEKRGNLTADIHDGTVNGTLSLLGHTEPFRGIINDNGECRINGKLITLMQTIEYNAIGTITGDTLQLFIQGGGNVFEVTGILHAEEEVQDT
ncbi:MAG: hypothetical protein ACI4QX_04405 [Lachnospiraceae bacterium]